MTRYIESFKMVQHTLANERLVIKAFPTSDAMYRFLNTGDNSMHWRESLKGLGAGTYCYAGGRWLNVKKLDALTLAHV